jgi:DNA-binding NarL/FixJ family response regulator
MRVILVGREADRARVRRQLEAEGLGIAIVGEAPTIAAAADAGLIADAYVTAAPPPNGSSPVGRHDAPILEPLTPRELEVLTLLAEGWPNKRIADRLGISDQTVKFHVSSICGKLGAANRTEAVRRALRNGLLAI